MTVYDNSITVNDDFFKDIPKVDIHCHLYGTIREATLKEFTRESGALMSDQEIADFFVRGEKPKGVLHAFRFMEKHILGSEDRLYRITWECLQDMVKDNVLYTELFWNSTGTLHHHPSLSFAAAQAAITGAMKDAEEEFGIQAYLIHAIDRECTPESAVALIEHILEQPDQRTLGLGIDYLETDNPPEKFWKAYRMARAAGLKTTAHAGEFGCHWRNIEASMNLLEVDRLDHCYTILENRNLLDQCVDRELVVTVVPSNSYYMRTLDPSVWAEKHPIRQMARQGIKIHPNTDDPTFHNVTPTLVWKMMHEEFGCSINQLRDFMLNGLDGAWMSQQMRKDLSKKFVAQFDAALAKHQIT